MTILIGLTPGEQGVGALHLGALVARSSADDVVVAVVVPVPWPPNPYRAEAEYLALQDKLAQEALDQARRLIGHDLVVDYRLHRARSVSSGLLEMSTETGATQVVLGSASSGVFGRVALGGLADRIMHSCDLPVILAPAGYQATAGSQITRVTVGFGRADRDSTLLHSTAAMATQTGSRLRVACFAVRPANAAGATIEAEAEDLVVKEWVRGLEVDIARAIGPDSHEEVDVVVGQGASWGEAIADVPWAEGDILAIGANSSPVSRFFLGSHATKIVRNAQVPVTLVPRALHTSAA